MKDPPCSRSRCRRRRGGEEAEGEPSVPGTGAPGKRRLLVSTTPPRPNDPVEAPSNSKNTNNNSNSGRASESRRATASHARRRRGKGRGWGCWGVLLLAAAAAPSPLVVRSEAFVVGAPPPKPRARTAGSFSVAPWSNPRRRRRRDRSWGVGARRDDDAYGDAPEETELWDRAVPRHVGFICDGNSRWARQRQLPALAGHAAGADRLVEVLQCLRREHPGVRVCTFYAFSTENWSRPPLEVDDIFRVMEATIRQFGPVLIKEGVEFRALGDVTDIRIPASLRLLMEDLHVRTRRHAAARLLERSRSTNGDEPAKGEGRPPQPPVLCVAINYGGRSDIVHAARQLARRVATGEIRECDIDEAALASHLSTSDLPDPDLIIRTSGESRLSNFFLWDAAYAELRFCDELWPDFDASSLRQALRWYAARHRRFGSRSVGGGSNKAEPTPAVPDRMR